MNITRAAIGGKDRLLAIVRDAGARKRAEGELRRAHVKQEQRLLARLQLLLESTDEGIFGVDLDYSPAAAGKLLGLIDGSF